MNDLDDWYGSPEAAAAIPDGVNTETLIDLPRGVRESLPSNAVGVWVDAYKMAVDLGDGSEETRAQAGWDAVKAQGWLKEETGRWRKTDKRLLRDGARAELAMLRLSIAKANGGWSKQSRVPSGVKGGQWTTGGGTSGTGGGGATLALQGQTLVAPHLGQGGIARHRFESDPMQQTFVAPLKQTEITGKPAFLDNPHGYVLMDPSTPTKVEDNGNPEDIATYIPDGDPGPSLNGIAFKPWDPPEDWTTVEGQGKFAEPPFPATGNKRLGAGVIIEEPDGRIWTINPLNSFGGYKETFPKGGIEEGLDLRQTAIKEAWEESGLKVELTGYLGDFERNTSVARYYRAKRVTGDPTDAHWETQSVNVLPLTELADRVVHHNDAPIIAAIMGESASVQKALCALADLIDLADYSASAAALASTSLAKAAGGGKWQKQMRVPKGLPKGGEWTTYGSGGIGGAYAAGGVALELQQHTGGGWKSEALNAKIAVFQEAANQGYLHPDAMKMLSAPIPVKYYPSLKYHSAAEAKAYVDNGGAGGQTASKADATQPTSHFTAADADLLAQLEAPPKTKANWEVLDVNGTELMKPFAAKNFKGVKSSYMPKDTEGAVLSAGKTAAQHQADMYLTWDGMMGSIISPGWKMTGDFSHLSYATPTAKKNAAAAKASYEQFGGYKVTPDGQVYHSAGNKPKSAPDAAPAPLPPVKAPTFDDITPVKPKVQQAGTIADPLKLSEMTKTGAKPGGSAAGGIHTDAYGQKWLVKSYNTPLQAMNEVTASKIYNSIGVHTPQMKLIDLGDSYKGGIGVASKFLDDVTPFDVNNPSHMSAVQGNLGAHAMLADWDAVGAAFDNVMISKTTGTAILVDPGGSMLFRAMGGEKGAAFADNVTELNTMRDPVKNATAAKVFGPMSESAIASSALEASYGFLDNTKAIAKIIDDHMGAPASSALKVKLTKRAVDIGNQAQQLQANIASSTGVGIAKTGTVTATPTHSNPNVTVQAALSGADAKSHIADLDSQIDDAKSAMTGTHQVLSFYDKKIDIIDNAAANGDIDGVKNALYVPATQSGKLSANYSNYLKAHAAAIKKAEAVAGQHLKDVPGAKTGSMVTGDAKVTPAQVESAKALSGAGKMASTLEPSVALHIEPTQTPKGVTPTVLTPNPAMPPKPFVISHTLNGWNNAIEAINNDPGLTPAHKAAQIHAISLQLPDTLHSHTLAVKSYAADSIAAHGGLNAIDTMPQALKTEALNDGLAKGNDAAGMPKPSVVVETKVEEFGDGYKLTQTIETTTTVNPPLGPDTPVNVADLPLPPDFNNYGGIPGKKYYNSKPELNDLNTAAAQGLYAAAKVSKTELDKIDVGYSNTLVSYKKKLVDVFTGHADALKAKMASWTPTTVETKVIGSELITGSGTPAKPAALISAIANTMSFPKNWLATAAQKIDRFVKVGSVDPMLAKHIYNSIPSVVTGTKGAVAKAMAKKTNSMSEEGKGALRGHVGGNWSSENNALYAGKTESSTWVTAMKKVLKINSVIYDLPVGLVLSRRNDMKGEMMTPQYWNSIAGTVMNHTGIASASIDGAWSGNTFFKIKVAEGVKGAYVADTPHVGLPDETEVVLPRNTKWIVVGARTWADAMANDPDLKEMRTNRQSNTGKFAGHYGAGTTFRNSDIVVEVIAVPHDYPE